MIFLLGLNILLKNGLCTTKASKTTGSKNNLALCF